MLDVRILKKWWKEGTRLDLISYICRKKIKVYEKDEQYDKDYRKNAIDNMFKI